MRSPSTTNNTEQIGGEPVRPRFSAVFPKGRPGRIERITGTQRNLLVLVRRLVLPTRCQRTFLVSAGPCLPRRRRQFPGTNKLLYVTRVSPVTYLPYLLLFFRRISPRPGFTEQCEVVRRVDRLSREQVDVRAGLLGAFESLTTNGPTMLLP